MTNSRSRASREWVGRTDEDGRTRRLSPGKAMSELEEGTFDHEEENGCGGKNANLNADKGESGIHRDVVGGTPLHGRMDHQLLNEVGAVSDAGDESDAGNSYPTQRQARTE